MRRRSNKRPPTKDQLREMTKQREEQREAKLNPPALLGLAPLEPDHKLYLTTTGQTVFTESSTSETSRQTLTVTLPDEYWEILEAYKSQPKTALLRSLLISIAKLLKFAENRDISLPITTVRDLISGDQVLISCPASFAHLVQALIWSLSSSENPEHLLKQVLGLEESNAK